MHKMAQWLAVILCKRPNTRRAFKGRLQSRVNCASCVLISLSWLSRRLISCHIMRHDGSFQSDILEQRWLFSVIWRLGCFVNDDLGLCSLKMEKNSSVIVVFSWDRNALRNVKWFFDLKTYMKTKSLQKLYLHSWGLETFSSWPETVHKQY